MRQGFLASALFVPLLVTSVLLSSCTKKSENAAPTPSLPPAGSPAATEEKTMTPTNTSARPRVKIETSMGTLLVELRPDKAPKTCENFLKLAKQGFYDGLTFHRVIPNFMIQGGDPEGTGMGGPGYDVPAEITDLKHTLGAVAMARKGDNVNPARASSGSQFYITVTEVPHLDGAYTVFGYVVEGQDVANKISQVSRDENDKPVTPVKIVKMTVVTP